MGERLRAFCFPGRKFTFSGRHFRFDDLSLLHCRRGTLAPAGFTQSSTEAEK
jgi:hypothetical protein